MQGVQGPIDLFSVINVDPEREQLYTGALACVADVHGGLYWALRTVDKDARSKRWDVYVIYVGPGATIKKLAYWFKQGSPEMPNAAGGVALAIRTDGKVILTVTEDTLAGSLFPPKVLVLDPVPGV